MKNNYLAKQKRQFKGLCKRISKNWETISTQERESLLSRFRRLYGNLKSAFARPALKKMMGAAALVVMSMGGVQAQQFAAPVQDTFGLNDVGSSAAPVLIDMDADGDLDMYVGEGDGTLTYFENLGTATNPSFSGGTQNIHAIDVGAESAPGIADLDNDGYPDLMIGEGSGDFYFFEHTGIPTNAYPTSGITNSLGLANTGRLQPKVSFVDIDNDGDYDMFSGENYTSSSYAASFFYYENIGSDSVPNFDAKVTNPFNLTILPSGNYRSAPTFVDIDNDGDYDMFSGTSEYNPTIFFFENTGTSSSPAFATPVADTFGITGVFTGSVTEISQSIPAFGDIDGDGDQDLFIGGTRGNIFFLENLAINTSINDIKEELIHLELYPNPVSEQLTIELSISTNYQIRITDLTGREIHSEFVQNDNNLQLSTQAWPAGLYLLQVRDEEGRVETKKVIKR